jgi:4-diphosphocytidyl-2-C-methyl-D-erythritol kinase
MMKKGIVINSYAKINLSLNITGRENGLHILDTVAASVNLADAVTVVPRTSAGFSIKFSRGADCTETDEKLKEIENGNNSALKAALIIAEEFPNIGANIRIEKNIPLSGGMGGSGVDAAAVIAGLDYLFDLSKKGFNARSAAHKTASDVPYLLSGGFARFGGTDGGIKPIAVAEELFLVAARGKGGVETRDSYNKFDALYPDFSLFSSDNDAFEKALIRADFDGICAHCGNALTAASSAINPEIESTLKHIKSCGAAAAFMTGSGSMCVGLFRNIKSASDASGELKNRGLEAYALKTVPRGIEILPVSD